MTSSIFIASPLLIAVPFAYVIVTSKLSHTSDASAVFPVDDVHVGVALAIDVISPFRSPLFFYSSI